VHGASRHGPRCSEICCPTRLVMHGWSAGAAGPQRFGPKGN
jgi:hypothetical protein